MRKKGQESAINASFFVGFLTLALVVYLILLPSSEKQKLIQNPSFVGQGPVTDYPSGTFYPGDSGGFISLLSESPGVVYPLLQQGLTKPLASVNLFSTSQRHEESLAQSLQFSKGIFSQEKQKLSLKLTDLQHIEQALLLFYVVKGTGDISITLNGQQIFSGVPTADVLPISVPVSLLKYSNNFEFSVLSSNFLSTNVYSLKDLVVILDYRVENMREYRTFELTPAEMEGLQIATLSYVVNCFTVQEQGRLLIRLNGKIVSDTLIVCDAGQIALDLSFADLLSGRNVLEFMIDNGKYVLEQVRIDALLGPQHISSYFFTLQVPQHQAIVSGVPVFLKLQFLNDDYRKVGTFFINGFPVYVDTYSDTFVYNISPLVTPGQNTVRFVPVSQMEIVSLDVTLG